MPAGRAPITPRTFWQVTQLQSMMQEETVRAGQTIWSRGEVVHDVLLVGEGKFHFNELPTSKSHPFEQGALLFDVTPAMTVVDVDGTLRPIRLAHASIASLVRGLDLFDIGGQVVIDFPMLGDKQPRKEFDQALHEALGKRPMERTAINGFGLVQLVSRLEGPSLLHRFATSRIGMAARMALRRAETVEGPGVTLLTVHPALKAKLKPEWLAELERRTARPVRIETDPGLAIEAATAQIVGHDV